MWGKLANWNNTKKMSWEERCCHSNWLVPPISASKCSSVSERSMAYTTRSTSCSSNTGQRCFCWQGRRGVLKTKKRGQEREVKQRKGGKDVHGQTDRKRRGRGNEERQRERKGEMRRRSSLSNFTYTFSCQKILQQLSHFKIFSPLACRTATPSCFCQLGKHSSGPMSELTSAPNVLVILQWCYYARTTAKL